MPSFLSRKGELLETIFRPAVQRIEIIERNLHFPSMGVNRYFGKEYWMHAT
jgi:hypothetical protein